MQKVGQVGQGWNKKAAAPLATVYDWALRFVLAGVAVIPVRYRDKRPAAREWKAYQRRIPSVEEVQRWFAGRNMVNFGVVTGWQGLTVLDFDDPQSYARWRNWAASTGGMAAQAAQLAFKVRTRRGVHVYTRLPQAVHNRHLDGLDIKSKGGYVLGPGSTHPSGARYTPLSDVLLFPLIPSLDAILPPELLVRADFGEDAPVRTPPVLQAKMQVSDPWEAASAPVFAGGGEQRGLVARIKEQLRIEDFFQPDELQRTGEGWYLARCPFHDDRHPSFWLNTERQIGGCFAGCTGKPVDAINLFAMLHGLDNRTAIAVLARRLGMMEA